MPRGKMVCYEKLATELYKYKWNDESLTFRKLLYTMYIEKEYSVQKIADELYMSKFKAYKLLQEQGIPARSNRRKNKKLRC